jgi:hypothetical protein
VHPVEADLGQSELTPDAQQTSELMIEDEGVREEDDEIADRDRALQHTVPADHEDDRGRGGAEHGRHRLSCGLHERRATRGCD